VKSQIPPATDQALGSSQASIHRGFFPLGLDCEDSGPGAGALPWVEILLGLNFRGWIPSNQYVIRVIFKTE
jgi:hypothetical protein